jgi:hypothetical protein
MGISSFLRMWDGGVLETVVRTLTDLFCAHEATWLVWLICLLSIQVHITTDRGKSWQMGHGLVGPPQSVTDMDQSSKNISTQEHIGAGSEQQELIGATGPASVPPDSQMGLPQGMTSQA